MGKMSKNGEKYKGIISHANIPIYVNFSSFREKVEKSGSFLGICGYGKMTKNQSS
jgi:hypothetical protein